MALHKEAERICRELGNMDGLSRLPRQPGVDSQSPRGPGRRHGPAQRTRAHLPRTRQQGWAVKLARQPGADPERPRGPGRRHGPAQRRRAHLPRTRRQGRAVKLARQPSERSSTLAGTWTVPWPCTKKKSASAANSATSRAVIASLGNQASDPQSPRGPGRRHGPAQRRRAHLPRTRQSRRAFDLTRKSGRAVEQHARTRREAGQLADEALAIAIRHGYQQLVPEFQRIKDSIPSSEQ